MALSPTLTSLLLETHFPSSPSHPSTTTRASSFLCLSSAKPPTTTQETPTPSSPSLSDQLKPLSLTLLKDNSNHLLLTPTKPKSTWVNPSRPKPSILSPHRQKRAPYSHHPELRRLSSSARNLSDLPDDDPDAFSAALRDAFPDPVSRDSALLVLNSIRSWRKTLWFFEWLKTQNAFPMETIFYNVAMKCLRFGRQYELVERLAEEMIQGGVELDNITYSTIITTAKRCRQYEKAIGWFERMYRTGAVPDEVTYSAVLDVYAQLGRREEVLSLYERARAGGWKPDAVAFAVLAKMFGEVGDYDGIQYVLQEMKSVGVEPNLVVYNTLLEALGKAGKPGLARSLFDDMLAAGVSPNEKTLTALIKIYGKARWSRDALELWERMRVNNWPMDFILYNTLLSMCADIGLEEEAERLFADMKRPERYCRPDSWSYTAMINIYASGGKADQALELFEEMLANRVNPNVMGCTCLIQGLGKAGRVEEAVTVLNTAMKRGVKPDDRLCGSLLSVIALSEEKEVGIVLECLEKINSRLVEFIKLLSNGGSSFEVVQEDFRAILNEAAVEVRRPFCNCLIDICRNRNFPPHRAHELLYLGNLYGLYPGLHARSSSEWSLNLRSLSVGAANTAFNEWMRSVSSSLENEEVLPEVFSVHAGAGTHKFSQGLASAFASHLKRLAAPFQQDEERSGSFVATKEDLISWVEAKFASPAAVA